MIAEEFSAALNDLAALAGTVPADVWEHLSPIHLRLRGVQARLGSALRPGTKRPTKIRVDDAIIEKLQHEIRLRIAVAGTSGRKWCAANDVNNRDLSFLLNHFERVRAGKQTISDPALERFVARFLGHDLRFTGGQS